MKFTLWRRYACNRIQINTRDFFLFFFTRWKQREVSTWIFNEATRILCTFITYRFRASFSFEKDVVQRPANNRTSCICSTINNIRVRNIGYTFCCLWWDAVKLNVYTGKIKFRNVLRILLSSSSNKLEKSEMVFRNTIYNVQTK